MKNLTHSRISSVDSSKLQIKFCSQSDVINAAFRVRWFPVLPQKSSVQFVHSMSTVQCLDSTPPICTLDFLAQLHFDRPCITLWPVIKKKLFIVVLDLY